jgi:hypothetical protein
MAFSAIGLVHLRVHDQHLADQSVGKPQVQRLVGIPDRSLKSALIDDTEAPGGPLDHRLRVRRFFDRKCCAREIRQKRRVVVPLDEPLYDPPAVLLDAGVDERDAKVSKLLGDLLPDLGKFGLCDMRGVHGGLPFVALERRDASPLLYCSF